MKSQLDYHFERAKKLAKLLDSRFNILGFKFGIDPILNIVPGLGSAIGVILSFYLFFIAYQIKLPGEVYIRMFTNIALDFLLGSVPGIGLIADAFYKANIKNLEILEKYYYPKSF